MEDHRRNAWYLLGATPLAAGFALAGEWLIAVYSHAAQGRPSYWATPFYVAMGLLGAGIIVVALIMTETWPFGFRKGQHEERPAGHIKVHRITSYVPNTVEEADVATKRIGMSVAERESQSDDSYPEIHQDPRNDLEQSLDAANVLRRPAEPVLDLTASVQHAKNLSDVYKYPEFVDDSLGDGHEILVDRSKLQRRPPPDFTAEYERFEVINADYSKSLDWDQTIDLWIEDVRVKLETWNPRHAQNFIEGDGELFPGITRLIMTAAENPDLARNPKLNDLYEMKKRLDRILDGR